MNKTVIAAAAVVVALGTAGIYNLDLPDDTKTIDGQKEVQISQQKVGKLTNGTKIYYSEVMVDSGIEYRLVQPKCKRLPIGARFCSLPDGGNPGQLNRMTDLIGPECQVVACSVYYGENADGREEDLIDKVTK